MFYRYFGTFSSTSPLLFDATHPIMIGGYSTTQEPFNGEIAELRIWNTTRTEQDILNNYKTTKVNKTNTNAPKQTSKLPTKQQIQRRHNKYSRRSKKREVSSTNWFNIKRNPTMPRFRKLSKDALTKTEKDGIYNA